jgi:hypothetical protein
MKTCNLARYFLAFVLTCLLLATGSYAQSLEVHESGGGNGTVTTWQTSWGSYSRDHHQTKKLRIIVRDISRHSPDGEVRAYFIARKQPQSDLFIYNHSTINVHFGGNMEVAEEIDAPSLYGRETYYRSWNEHVYHGASMEGWIILER